MVTTPDQVTSCILELSGLLYSDSLDTHQSQAPCSESPLDRDSSHEVLLELGLDNKALLEFCDRHLLTTCSVFQTAWAIVVSCYAEVEDVSFVYGTNDGQSSDSKPARVYPCRAQIAPKSRLLETLLSAKKSADNWFSNVDPSNTECFDDSSSSAASAFSSTLYVKHQLGRQVGLVEQEDTPSRNRLLVQLVIKDNAMISLSMRARAHASKFSAAQVSNLAHTLEKTLGEIIKSHPQSLIGDLDICSQRDLEQIMSWNQSTLSPVESCFHWHFEAVARRTPDATAICSWDRSFTYQELDMVSTKLATNLRHLGVMPGMFIGMCFSKTSIAYVCMLSILKAGAAFVAIDPSYPVNRIQTIVEATKASIFVTEPRYCHLFDDFAKHTMAMNTKTIDEFALIPNLPEPQSKPSDVVYAVFTSGSTGLPKGIMIEHRSLCSAVFALAPPMRIDSSSRVLQFAAYTFDVSYGDTFTTLAQGGCICVPSEHERINDISGAIVRMNVNNACLIPSVARMLQPEDVPCLKVLNLGAEALLKDNLDTWAEKVTLSVVYGPTECTIWCASQTELKVNSPPSTIGRGVGALLWITSATNHNRLCPIGCIGELLIEGPGLARGYLDAEQTSSAFIENPSWAQTKSGQRRRFYKTGDLVRYQPDGTLTFIGRKDTQIKFHGRRIELGEIEYHLSCHASLKQSIVLLPNAGKYRQKLVAILVFQTPTGPSSSSTELNLLTTTAMKQHTKTLASIKQSLSTKLPPYMFPQEYIAVESIPLMTSDKMNRVLSRNFVESLTHAVHGDTLPSPSPSPPPQTHATPTPTPNLTASEESSNHLRQIWSLVLDTDMNEIELDTSFTSLGGDSFIAMDLIARCKAEGYDGFTAKDLLDGGTVRQMIAKMKVVGSISGSNQSIDQRKSTAVKKPLVLRPIWWDTD